MTEITGLLNLTSWLTGVRVIIRAERVHPGAAADHRHRRAPARPATPGTGLSRTAPWTPLLLTALHRLIAATAPVPDTG